ncbi:MAG TPA: hypothetical protein ENG73_11335 [Desulfobacterales bacterium]|nr:hypothetical protein [Desulfobacterales bacterium]
MRVQLILSTKYWQKVGLTDEFLAERLGQLEGWIYTYLLPPFDGTGGIGGPVATYWASSPYAIGPYVMNSYGIIRGLCARAADGPDARARAEKFALFYLRIQDPTSGLFISSWGETPFIPLGLVQQASVVAALWDLHRVWPNNEVAKIAERGWKACIRHPTMKRLWNVYNQALRACEALILRAWAWGDSYPLKQDRQILQRVGRMILSAQWPDDGSIVAGAIPQSASDDRIIMPYQGKCLYPLILLGEVLQAPQYIEAARKLADFILRIMDVEQEYLLPGSFLPKGRRLRTARWFYRGRYIWPWMEPVLQQYRRWQIADWYFNPRPRWIARGFDTARGLFYLGQVLDEERYKLAAIRMVREALRYQSPIGGIRNTLGFFGRDPQEIGGLVWQDALPIPRWNSYAIQFLHELLSGTPLRSPIVPSTDAYDEVKLAYGCTLFETADEVKLTDASGKQIWMIRKGFRWGRPFKPALDWNEGAAVNNEYR